jgi:hypothetical protein
LEKIGMDYQRRYSLDVRDETSGWETSALKDYEGSPPTEKAAAFFTSTDWSSKASRACARTLWCAEKSLGMAERVS